jgi:uncharacterized protein (DUF1330 family)
MAGLVPAIHVFTLTTIAPKAWMPGTNPGMTAEMAEIIMTSKAEQFGAALGKAFKKTAEKIASEQTPRAYYIGQHIISDQGAFDIYLAKTIPFIEKHGGRYLTRSGTHEMLEGDKPTRVVIVEFPSKDAAKAWYNDPGYQPLIPDRHAVTKSTMILIDGV